MMLLGAITDTFQAFEDLQNSIDGPRYVVPWLVKNSWVPWAVAVGYVAAVHVGQKVMKNREPLKLKFLFTWWNFLLAIFSVVGGLTILPALGSMAMNNPITSEDGVFFCKSGKDTYYHGKVGFWMLAFVLSKIPELMDTVFLVLQKKPVIFLHWYHHASVMLYCWLAATTYQPAGIVFAGMNYFVHSIMYTYYFMMNISNVTRSIAKPFAKTVTTLQLSQMVVGIYLSVGTYNRLGPKCASEPWVTYAALAMYASYFVLFGHFFYNAYLSPKAKARIAARKQQQKQNAAAPATSASPSSSAKKDARGAMKPATTPLATLRALGASKHMPSS